MGTLSNISTYLIQTILSLYLLAMLLRFLLQVVRADFYNPISQFLVKITSPLVIPVRRVVPSLGGLDIATLLLALLLQVLGIVAIMLLKGWGFPTTPLLGAWAILGIIWILVNIYFFTLLAMIVMSWVAPRSRHPAVNLLHQITEPVMAPVRKILPPMGGLDFSPIVVFILIHVIKIVLFDIAVGIGMPGGVVMGL